MKVLGTNIMIGGEKLDTLRKMGYKGYHSQFRIICKCKSMAEANRKCEALGFYKKVFSKDYSCETGNKLELELCEIEDVWICLDGTIGNRYVKASELCG